MTFSRIKKLVNIEINDFCWWVVTTVKNLGLLQEPMLAATIVILWSDAFNCTIISGYLWNTVVLNHSRSIDFLNLLQILEII